MTKRYFIFLLVLTLCLTTLAQKLTLKAPSQVLMGRSFQVQYVLDKDAYEKFDLNDNFNGFDVQYGPAVSKSSRTININGHVTHNSSVTFTVTLLPNKLGTFTIPAATVVTGGQKIKSGSAQITVLQNNDSYSNDGKAEKVNSKDIFFTVTASKKHVHEQEAVLLTYKLYSLLSVEQIDGEIPVLDGFHTQEIKMPDQQSFKMERYNGRTYGTVEWRKYVVYPQHSGVLTIPPISFKAIAMVRREVEDPIDAFFNFGTVMERAELNVRAPSIDITVDPLPTRPANFSGAVGKDFSISGKLSPLQIDANDATTLNLTVSGTGNIQLMTSPTVNWPHDFETYDPKRKENLKLTNAGNKGTVNLEYVAVPHHGGKYTIAPVEFCYYDTDKNAYVTLRTDSFELGVAKVVNTGSSVAPTQEDIRQLGDDIRFIKTNDLHITKPGDTMFGSLRHLLFYLAILILFILIMILFRKQAKANADVVGRRGRRASKVATKRLRLAGKMLKSSDSEHFYDEVMHALWGYVADKLNLPVSELNKDNVSEKLMQRGIDQDTINMFLLILGDCEFARFAPGDPVTNMENMYISACDIIDQIDVTINK